MSTPEEISAWWEQVFKRDWSAEARGIVRGTYEGRVTRFHVIAVACDLADARDRIADLEEELGRFRVAANGEPGAVAPVAAPGREKVIQFKSKGEQHEQHRSAGSTRGQQHVSDGDYRQGSK